MPDMLDEINEKYSHPQFEYGGYSVYFRGWCVGQFNNYFVAFWVGNKMGLTKEERKSDDHFSVYCCVGGQPFSMVGHSRISGPFLACQDSKDFKDEGKISELFAQSRESLLKYIDGLNSGHPGIVYGNHTTETAEVTVKIISGKIPFGSTIVSSIREGDVQRLVFEV